MPNQGDRVKFVSISAGGSIPTPADGATFYQPSGTDDLYLGSVKLCDDIPESESIIKTSAGHVSRNAIVLPDMDRMLNDYSGTEFRCVCNQESGYITLTSFTSGIGGVVPICYLPRGLSGDYLLDVVNVGTSGFIGICILDTSGDTIYEWDGQTPASGSGWIAGHSESAEVKLLPDSIYILAIYTSGSESITIMPTLQPREFANASPTSVNPGSGQLTSDARAQLQASSHTFAVVGESTSNMVHIYPSQIYGSAGSTSYINVTYQPNVTTTNSLITVVMNNMPSGFVYVGEFTADTSEELLLAARLGNSHDGVGCFMSIYDATAGSIVSSSECYLEEREVEHPALGFTYAISVVHSKFYAEEGHTYYIRVGNKDNNSPHTCHLSPVVVPVNTPYPFNHYYSNFDVCTRPVKEIATTDVDGKLQATCGHSSTNLLKFNSVAETQNGMQMSYVADVNNLYFYGTATADTYFVVNCVNGPDIFRKLKNFQGYLILVPSLGLDPAYVSAYLATQSNLNYPLSSTRGDTSFEISSEVYDNVYNHADVVHSFYLDIPQIVSDNNTTAEDLRLVVKVKNGCSFTSSAPRLHVALQTAPETRLEITSSELQSELRDNYTPPSTPYQQIQASGLAAIGAASKNLVTFDPFLTASGTYLRNRTSNGVTYDADPKTGIIQTSGTNTSASSIIITLHTFRFNVTRNLLVSGGPYSTNVTAANADGYLYCYDLTSSRTCKLWNGQGDMRAVTSYQTVYECQFPADHVVQLRMRINVGKTVDGFKWRPMVWDPVVGDTTFEPGSPISAIMGSYSPNGSATISDIWAQYWAVFAVVIECATATGTSVNSAVIFVNTIGNHTTNQYHLVPGTTNILKVHPTTDQWSLAVQTSSGGTQSTWNIINIYGVVPKVGSLLANL